LEIAKVSLAEAATGGSKAFARRSAQTLRDKSSSLPPPLPANPAACYRRSRPRKKPKRKPSDKAVTPGPHPRGEQLMKRCAKDLIKTLGLLAFSGLLIAAVSAPAAAQKKYEPGVSDTEIKIGNIMPYSGPASAYGIIGKTMSAYFRMINDNGGVNGRKINFISYDDAYSPPKTVEQARKLVESDEVFLIFASLGTASNAAIQKYMNTMKVPQLFVATGASRWGDPEHFPWTIGWQPNYRAEARIYATYILQHHPAAKLGILYQNDDCVKDYVVGLKYVLSNRYDTW